MNDFHFKIHFDAKHEGGHYFKVKYNWINKVEGSNPVEYESTIEEDLGFLKDWNLV